MDYQQIRFSCSQDLARITLARPEKLNSFTRQMHLELRDALDRTRTLGARCLVIAGDGRAFCAGQDLSERQFEAGHDPDLGASIEELYKPLILTIQSLDLPVIAAVNGVAAGAGASLALACDIVLAARSARFIQAFSRIGLAPDAGASYFLPRLAGQARALAMALTGDAVSAEQAERWGLIWRCVDDPLLEHETQALASGLACGPTRALALTKRAFRVSWQADSLEAQINIERDIQRELGKTVDYREGVSAFREKRPAAFKGR